MKFGIDIDCFWRIDYESCQNYGLVRDLTWNVSTNF